MTRKEKIKGLEQMLSELKSKMNELKSEIKIEKVHDFYESNNLKEGQHFMYNGKECVGVEYGDFYYIKTRHITKNGEISKMPTIIYDSETIKSI